MIRIAASCAVFLTAFLFAFGPLIVAMFDLFCWIAIGSTGTGVDWGDKDRVVAMVCWTVVVPLPAFWLAIMVDEVLT